ncbi:MAG: alpha/beta fold hydrolase [Micromonosporaceae bacterium]|nr:alpha/beta fold hydrolase [Micromonosporaceae bacterium]
MKATHRSVPVSGTRLAYYTSDRPGPPVVLLHPWFGCPQFWCPTVAHLADRRCYVVDLYSPAGGDWSAVASPEGLAGAVLAMLDAERLDRVDLVGNSLGGIVAQLLASTAPDRVRRLVLVGTGASTDGVLPGFGEKVSQWIAGASRASAPRAEVAEIVDMLVTRRPDPATWEGFVEAVWRTDPAYLAAVLAAARSLDLTPRLPQIAAPTLVIRGGHDCARTPAHVAALVAGIPRARAVELPDAGHAAMVDHPEEFSRLVAAHLAGWWPDPPEQSASTR